MKNWKMVVCLVSVAFFIMAGTACQQSGAAKSSEFRGALYKEKDGDRLYFRTGGKRYEVESQQDLSEMIGKTLTLKGAISDKEGKATIVVDAVGGSTD